MKRQQSEVDEEMDITKQTLLEEDLRDLGFGSKVTEQTRLRLLNKDGSFNVERRGFSVLRSLSPYHFLLTMP